MFFSEIELANDTGPHCAACRLKDTCNHFQAQHRGTGDALAVFPCPSVETDYNGKLAGLPLFITQGLFRGKIRVGYSVACNSPKVTDKQIECCGPFFLSNLQKHKPRVIYTFGPEALFSVIRFFRGKSIGPFNRWIGEKVPIHFESFSCWVVPLFDVKEYGKKNTGNTAFALSKDFLVDDPAPIKKMPKVVIYYETSLILRAIENFKNSETPVAFDYETTGLKPDTMGHKILCVGMSNGEFTTAFQISKGEIQDAFVSFLKSTVPKIAANLKFEERWSRKIFKTRVNNWVFDSMLNAHLANAAPRASGLKFQAFTKLGIPPYDEEVENLIRAKKPNEKNDLESMDTHKLLQYCGTDAWAEYELYKEAK